MPACQLVSQNRRGRAEIHLSGTFDGTAAWEVVQQLKQTRGDIVLDFSRIDTFFDYGLAVLAHGLQEKGSGVLLIGLRHHQLRLLRYLGVEVSDAGVVGPKLDTPIIAVG